MACTNIDLVRYDFTKLPSSGFFLLVGKRGTGKTTYAQWISGFSPYKTRGIFCVMAGSESVKHAWSNIVPNLFIVDPSTAYLKTLRITQNTAIANAKSQNISFPDSCHVTLFMDDVASIPTIMKSPEMAYLASNSRHLQTTIFITCQHIYQLPTQVRSQFDIIMALTTSNIKNIKILHEEYANCVDKRIFQHIVTVATEEHGILVLDNTKASSIISDICFFARIEPYPTELEKLGPEIFWTFATDHSCIDTTKKDVIDMKDDSKNIVIDDKKNGRIIIRKT